MSYVNVGGVWKDGTDYVNVNGVWKQKSQIYTNVNGVWKGDISYPKFSPTLVFPTLSVGNITGHGAGWVSDGYQLSIITGYEGYDSLNRIYACGSVDGYWVYKIKKGDIVEWTASYINYGNSGRDATLYIGFFDRLPSNNTGWYPLPLFSASKYAPYSSNWTSISQRTTYTGNDEVMAFGLMIDLGYSYQHIVCTIHSVKLNGYEILR